jgi:acetate---CoA ligase (ADP-forming)
VSTTTPIGITPPATSSSLAVFRDPRSVAVVGASDDPGKWGNWLARGALLGRERRSVHLVNRNGGEVAGIAAARSLEELPETPELVVLCVPARHLEAVVDQGLDRGVRGFLVITAGLDHVTGRPGAERQLAERVRSRGARLVGPNCLGIYDAQTDLQLAWGSFLPGALGIVSQSGQVGSEIADLAADAGIGVSRLVSVGSQVDVTAEEAVADLIDHEQTRLVALYLESFDDGRRLISTLQRLRDAGKPTLLLTVGGSDAGREAARSHTGALTSPSDVIEAACRAAGCLRVPTPSQLIDVARLVLRTRRLPTGSRVAIVGDSGGQGAIAADVAAAHGLTVAPLDPDVRSRLADSLPPGAGVGNPVDLAGAGERDLRTYARVVRTVAEQVDVDAVLLTGYFGSYGAQAPELAPLEIEVARRFATIGDDAGCPVVVHSMAASSGTLEVLEETGVPTYRTIDGAITGLVGGARLQRETGRRLPRPDGVPGTAGTGYWSARRLLVDAGVEYPPAALIHRGEDLEPAARTITGPYVLKADWLAHKSDHGGVVTGLPDRTAIAEAYATMVRRLGPGDLVLEQMDRRTDTVDLLVGARRDPSFGVFALVGSGGVETEVDRDKAVELAPISEDVAVEMLGRLRSAPLLQGWRGRSAIATDAVVRVLVILSELLSANPTWSAIEINPLRAGPDRAVALDALITFLAAVDPAP